VEADVINPLVVTKFSVEPGRPADALAIHTIEVSGPDVIFNKLIGEGEAYGKADFGIIQSFATALRDHAIVLGQEHAGMGQAHVESEWGDTLTLHGPTRGGLTVTVHGTLHGLVDADGFRLGSTTPPSLGFLFFAGTHSDLANSSFTATSGIGQVPYGYVTYGGTSVPTTTVAVGNPFDSLYVVNIGWTLVAPVEADSEFSLGAFLDLRAVRNTELGTVNLSFDSTATVDSIETPAGYVLSSLETPLVFEGGVYKYPAVIAVVANVPEAPTLVMLLSGLCMLGLVLVRRTLPVLRKYSIPLGLAATSEGCGTMSAWSAS